MKKTVKILALLLVVLLLTSLVCCTPSPKLAKVTFVYGNGMDNKVSYVFVGDKTAFPAIPQDIDGEISGWYRHADCEESSEWDFDTDRVEGDVTLYAKWKIPDPEPKPDPKPEPPEPFEDFGLNVIDVFLADVDVKENGLYTSMTEVAAYIYLYRKLPSNFHKKSTNLHKQYTSSNKNSAGGDRFYNNEGLLPKASGRTFTECDIDYRGGSRGAKRIVFSSDWLIFYTSDHYGSFSIVRIHENNS